MARFNSRLGTAMVLIALALTACSGDDDEQGEEGPPIPVSGNFNGSSHSSYHWMDRFLDRFVFPRAEALSASAVSKVVSFSRAGVCRTASVSGGTFTVDVNTQTASGLIFLNSSDAQIGYLSLQNGIDSLPLMNVASGVGSLDLGAVASSSTQVTPGSSPLGSALSLSSDEQTAIAQGNVPFASVVKAADVDGDGTVDCLQSRSYRANFMYYINGGSFGSGTTATPTAPASISQWIFAVQDHNGAITSDPVFNGPGGSNLTSSGVYFKSEGFYESNPVSSPTIPPAGTYTATFGGTVLSFAMGSQASANNNVILAVPSVTLSGDTLSKVSWTYKLGSGSGTLDAADVISKIELQIDGSGTKCPEATGGGNRMYDSGFVSPSVTEHTLTCAVSWSTVTNFYMAYDDLFGNHYVVTFTK
jgi:hypothetical protein